MERIFRAKKMLDRVKAEGKENLLDDETIAFIVKLDGKKANDYNWASVVRDEPLCWIAPDEDQNGTYVALCDCEEE